ncbi:MAG: 23S rRNA (pseudouridine(1915)-N(3))-methyltransferase RlmH [Myxococcota bacterium]
MKIVIFSFEKIDRSPFEEIIKEYKIRVAHRFVIEERVIKSKKEDISAQIDSLLNKYDNAFICVLDENGKKISTTDFADMLIKLEQNHKRIIFLIGPPDGFLKPIRFRYDMILSLSIMTFSHQIARLLLYEQIYRVYCAITGHPYNK